MLCTLWIKLACFSYINQVTTLILCITLLFQLEVVVNYKVLHIPNPLFISCGFMGFFFLSWLLASAASVSLHCATTEVTAKQIVMLLQIKLLDVLPSHEISGFIFHFLIIFWLGMKINLLYTWNQHEFFLSELKSLSKNKQLHPLYYSPVIFARCFLCYAMQFDFDSTWVFFAGAA